MADTFVQLPDDSGNTGKKEDHSSIANGNLREVINIGDPSVVAAVAGVVNADPGGSDYGAVVRDPRMAGLATSLTSIDGKITAVNTGAVVVSSSALPTGAATAAKQPALGTAGTASADVISIQGIAGMTAVKVDGSGATQPVSGTVTANAGTNLNTSALALESGGNLAAASSVLGATSGAAVITDANGTIQQYLRGLVKLLITSGTIVLGAGTALLGKISGSDETSTIYNGTTALTPKFAVISTSSSGASQVVAAVSSHKIRVINVVLMANAAVNVKFQSHVSPTDLTGLLYLAANTGFAPGYIPTGHFETISGEALDINLSGAIAVGGWLTYIEV